MKVRILRDVFLYREGKVSKALLTEPENPWVFRMRKLICSGQIHLPGSRKAFSSEEHMKYVRKFCEKGRKRARPRP